MIVLRIEKGQLHDIDKDVVDTAHNEEIDGRDADLEGKARVAVQKALHPLFENGPSSVIRRHETVPEAGAPLPAGTFFHHGHIVVATSGLQSRLQGFGVVQRLHPVGFGALLDLCVFAADRIVSFVFVKVYFADGAEDVGKGSLSFDVGGSLASRIAVSIDGMSGGVGRHGTGVGDVEEREDDECGIVGSELPPLAFGGSGDDSSGSRDVLPLVVVAGLSEAIDSSIERVFGLCLRLGGPPKDLEKGGGLLGGSRGINVLVMRSTLSHVHLRPSLRGSSGTSSRRTSNGDSPAILGARDRAPPEWGSRLYTRVSVRSPPIVRLVVCVLFLRPVAIVVLGRLLIHGIVVVFEREKGPAAVLFSGKMRIRVVVVLFRYFLHLVQQTPAGASSGGHGGAWAVREWRIDEESTQLRPWWHFREKRKDCSASHGFRDWVTRCDASNRSLHSKTFA